MQYSDYIKKPSSEKNILMWVEPSEFLVLWTLVSGSIYKRTITRWVVSVKQNGTALTKANNASLSSGEWYFDQSNRELYVRCSDDSDPTNKINATYRMFFAQDYVDAPYDLDSGKRVDYEARINNVSSFKQSIGDNQTGIALDGSGRVSLINADGYFDDIYDKYFWENCRVVIYSYSPLLDTFTQAQKIFEGTISDKSFNDREVTFRVVDFIAKLGDQIKLPIYSVDDNASIGDAVIGKPKRRIYGRVVGCQAVPLDDIREGYALTGALSGTINTTTVTGSGTSFLSELLQGDVITVADQELTVEAIDSDTSLTVSDDLTATISGQTATVEPARPYVGKGRIWNVAGHKLREPSTTITNVLQRNRFDVNDVTDFLPGDSILVDGTEFATIKRISGNRVTLNANLNLNPNVGDTVVKNPVSAVYYLGNKLVVDRDYSVDNTSTYCNINITSSAEFNIAKIRNIGTCTFTSGDRTVTAGSGVNFEATLRPGDWLRSNDPTHQVWYRVSSITDETNLELQVAYAAANRTNTVFFKSPEYLDSNSLVSVDCIGKENADGIWVKTAALAVKDMLETDIGLTNIDENSFDLANDKAFYTLSLLIPDEPLGKAPKYRDVINKINQSVFGSVIPLSNFDIAYRILDSEKPDDLELIQDDDIFDYSVKSKMETVKKVIGNYRAFDLSRYEGKKGFLAYEFTSPFVDENINVDNEETIDIYLYDDEWAKNIVQRYALIRSLSRSTVNLRTNLLFALKSLGDKIWIKLDRLYRRYGSSDRGKIGIIVSIENDGEQTSVQLEDYGNIFNRVPAIAPDTAVDFSNSTESDRIKYGYVVDNTTETPNTSSELEKGVNLIG